MSTAPRLSDVLEELPAQPFGGLGRLLAQPFSPTHVHFRGGLYEVLGYGRSEENMTQQVMYRGQDNTVWVRPLRVFTMDVEPGVPRFRPLYSNVRA